MKLEKIHFRNLASLNGEWTIDLTEPMIRDAGIFAMAGPVGSGKTTVFDAVRLALYGRTSRLSRITKNENEIMSRGTSECFAEVIFSCPSGRYLCRWSQHRAKSGQLQNAKHILAKYSGAPDDAEILTSKLEETRERILAVTGMDFNHFSRAVILPQGQFANFLQAGAAERSPILEQITGTGIYAEISMKVFDICRRLNQELDLIQKSAENIELISGEQIEEWKKTVSELRKNASESLEKYNTRSELLLKRKNLETEQNALSHLKTQLPAAECDCQLAKTALADAEKALIAAKESRDSLMPILKRIRDLDSRIKMGKEALAEFVSALNRRESAKNEDVIKLEKKTELLQEKKSVFARTTEFLEKKKEDSRLAKELSGLENLCGTIVSLLNETDDLRRKLSSLIKSEKRKEEETDKLRDKVRSSDSSLKELAETLESKQKELTELTGGTSVPEFFQKKEKLQQKNTLLEKILSLLKQENDLDSQLKKLNAAAASANEKIKSLEELLAIQKKLVAKTDENLQSLEQKRLMESKIAAYEKDRKNLSDGQKCPLCGSEKHPYIEHMPLLSAEDDYAKARKDLKEEEQKKSRMEQDLNREMLQRTTLENEIGRISEVKKETESAIEALPWRDFGNDHSEALAKLGSEIRTAADLLAVFDSTVRQIEPAMKEASAMEQKISKMREENNQLHLKLKESETTLSALHLQREQNELDFRKKEKTAEEGSESFRLRLSQFGIPGETSFPDAVAILKQRMQLFESQRDAHEELEKEIIALQTFVSTETTRLENEKNTIVLQKAESAKRKQALDQLIKVRQDEFGSKSPDDEEKRAEDAVKSAEESRKDAAESVEKTSEHYSQLSARTEDVRKRIAVLEKILTEADVMQIPLETLRQQISELDVQRQEQNQRIGEVSEKLARAEESGKHAAELSGRIEEKKKECSKWEYLNSLIGSADGKKYRDFVQSLTLEKLIVNANDQLRHFTDRYTLISDRETGLDFDVVDSYRGNEIRSSRNLSGGETFLISLALALGLSHMAHGTMRIDTLFLDEGFGTLDEESLQHALEQLAGLRRSGKLIGIITHAHGIEDAVPVVLKFTNHGGYSSITGPGVTQKSADSQEK